MDASYSTDYSMNGQVEQSTQVQMTPSLIPIILHSNLQKATFTDYLGPGFKLRVSNKTAVDSVILPRSGVAVLIVSLTKVASATSSVHCSTEPETSFQSESQRTQQKHLKEEQQQQQLQQQSGEWSQETIEQLVERIAKFRRNFARVVIILVGPVFGEHEIGSVAGHLQKLMLPKPPPLLLAHGDAQAAAHIQHLAKSTQSDIRAANTTRIEELLNAAYNKDFSQELLRISGLSLHRSSMLCQSGLSISELVTQSRLYSEGKLEGTNISDEEIKAFADFNNFIMKDQVPL